MSTALIVLHLGTGIAYLGAMAGLVARDLLAVHRTQHRLPRYGLALFCMAATIGLHHLEMASHFTKHTLNPDAPLDLTTVTVAFLFAAVWVWLRVESELGGSGDRRLFSLDWWRMVVGLSGFYVGVVTTVALYEIPHVHVRGDHVAYATMQIPLILLYVVIAWWLVITQVTRYLALGQGLGYWSVSGMTLGLMFFTLAMNRVSFLVYRLNGRYDPNPHLAIIDLFGVVAALWFCRQVRSTRSPGDRWQV